MTCIIGMKNKKGTILLSDSGYSSGYHVTEGSNPKICRDEKNDVVVGGAGSLRLIQVIVYECRDIFDSLKYLDEYNNITEWVVLKYIPHIREKLKDSGFTKVSENVEKGGTILLGIKDELFQISTDFSAYVPVEGFASIGSGWETATAAMRTLLTLRGDGYDVGDDIDIMNRAMDVAAKYIWGVQAPYLCEMNYL